MLEEAKINFYRVHKCGYYRRAKDVPEFGQVGSMLAELKAWAFDAKKPLAETCTYELDDEGTILHTYCFDMKVLGNGDVILTTWNETETLDGGMASVNGSDPAGSANVNTTAVPPGHIPGYPTYFWFIPSHNAFVTLRFDQRANGHAGLRLLLSDFLAKFTKHVVYGPPNDDGEELIIGYREKSKDKPQRLTPSFRSNPERLPGPLEFLRKNRMKIKKVIRKNVLSPQNQDDRTLWQKLCHNLGITNSPKLTSEVKLKAELPFTPGKEELKEIIDEWESETNSKWNDVGFEMSGEEDIKWLSHTLVKTKLDLDVTRDSKGVISVDSIADAVTTHRAVLLSMLV